MAEADVRVLVVEDDRNLMRLLREYLGREGFVVHESLDGADALERDASEPARNGTHE